MKLIVDCLNELDWIPSNVKILCADGMFEKIDADEIFYTLKRQSDCSSCKHYGGHDSVPCALHPRYGGKNACESFVH